MLLNCSCRRKSQTEGRISCKIGKEGITTLTGTTVTTLQPYSVTCSVDELRLPHARGQMHRSLSGLGGSDVVR